MSEGHRVAMTKRLAGRLPVGSGVLLRLARLQLQGADVAMGSNRPADAAR